MVHLKTKPLALSKTEFYRLQLHFILRGVKLTKSEELLLIYYHMYPNPHERLVDDGVFGNPKSIDNYLVGLRKKGLILGKHKETRLNPRIKFIDHAFKLTVDVTPEEGSNEPEED